MASEQKSSGLSASKIIDAAALSVDTMGKTKVKSGRRENASRLFHDAYFGFIFNHAQKCGCNTHDAEDIYQRIAADFLLGTKSFRFDRGSQRYYEKNAVEHAAESRTGVDHDAPASTQGRPDSASCDGVSSQAFAYEPQKARSARFQRRFCEHVRALMKAKNGGSPRQFLQDAPVVEDLPVLCMEDVSDKLQHGFASLLRDMVKEYARFIWRRSKRETPLDAPTTDEAGEESVREYPSDQPAADAIAAQQENWRNLQEIYAEAMRRLGASAKTPAQVRDFEIFKAVSLLRPSRQTNLAGVDAPRQNVREELMKKYCIQRQALDTAVSRMYSKMRSVVEALLAGDFQHLNVEELLQSGGGHAGDAEIEESLGSPLSDGHPAHPSERRPGATIFANVPVENRLRDQMCIFEDFLEELPQVPSECSLVFKEGNRTRVAPIRDELTVGRLGGVAHEAIDVPHMSKVHFSVSRHEEGFKIRDLNSRNGTYVNGRRWDERQDRCLVSGDCIEAGGVHFVFVEEAVKT